MKTNDGGTTWTVQTVDTTFSSLFVIRCTSVVTCYVLGLNPGAPAFGFGPSPFIYGTRDGGASWSLLVGSWCLLLEGCTTSLADLSCASLTACVAVGGDRGLPYVSWTSDGSHWNYSAPAPSLGSVTAVGCTVPATCVATGLYGGIARSTDGGATWRVLTQINGGSPLNRVTCPNVTTCYAVANAGKVFVTGDGGSTWTAESAGIGNVYGIDCVRPTICLAAGSRGGTSLTLDGKRWSPQSSSTNHRLSSVAFPDLGHAWVAGDGGTVLANADLIPSCSSATLTSDKTSPQAGATTVTFTASAAGPGCSSPLYEYWMWSASSGWVLKQPYSTKATFVLDTSGWTPRTYTVDVWVEESGSALGTGNYETFGLKAWVVGGCDSATLTPNPAPTTGMVTFTATAAGIGCSNAQYQFFMWSPATSWVLKQAYSPMGTWTLDTTTLGPGTYTIDVWVKQQNSPLTYETWALSSLPKGACGSTTLTPGVASPQSVGGTVSLSAVAAGCSSPQYQYWIYPGIGGGWQMLQDYSSSGTYNWNTAGWKPGTYSLVVHVRQGGSTAAYDTFGLLSYSVTGAFSAALVASPVSPQPLGTPITLTASAPGSAPQYQFWVYILSVGWKMVQDYSATATYIWNTTPIAPGTYAWVVYVQQLGSGNAFDSYALFSDSVG